MDRQPAATSAAIVLTLRRQALFPNHYCWYILACALDLLLTATILIHFGGIEVNGVAHRIIESFGLGGLVAFKFATVLLVVGICEVIGRRHEARGRRLAEWAIALSAIPVMLALIQVAVAVANGHLPA
jgi:hypothetical protein